MLNSRSPPSIFPSSLVTDPAQEAVEKVGRDIVKALDWIPSNKDTVPRSKAALAKLS